MSSFFFSYSYSFCSTPVIQNKLRTLSENMSWLDNLLDGQSWNKDSAPSEQRAIPVLIICSFNMHIEDSSNILVSQLLKMPSSNNLVFQAIQTHSLSHLNHQNQLWPYLMPETTHIPHSPQHLPVMTCKFPMDVGKHRRKGRGNIDVVTLDWIVNQKIILTLTEKKNPNQIKCIRRCWN